MSDWMLLALAIIVAGGFTILARLRLLGIAVLFWLTFAAGIGVLALSGHAMTARWHLGPITGGYFWWVLVTSPELLVFLFFMITDPKTIPSGRFGRRLYAVGHRACRDAADRPPAHGVRDQGRAARRRSRSPARARALLELAPGAEARARWLVDACGCARRRRVDGRRRADAGRPRSSACCCSPAFPRATSAGAAGPTARMPGVSRLPQVTIGRSSGVAVADRQRHGDADRPRRRRRSARPGRRAAAAGRHARVRRRRAAPGSPGCSRRYDTAGTRGVRIPTYSVDRIRRPSRAGQGPGAADGRRRLPGQRRAHDLRRHAATSPCAPGSRRASCRRSTCSSRAVASGSSARAARAFAALATPATTPAITAAPVVSAAVARAAAQGFASVRLTDVAKQVGLDFRQGSFRYGVDAAIRAAMMGGGVCWIDYDNDGWMDLFVVNSYSDANIAELAGARRPAAQRSSSTTCGAASST